MSKSQDIKLIWSCMLGSKSHINIAGKIVFFPFIVVIGVTLTFLELSIVGFDKVAVIFDFLFRRDE